MLTGEAGNSHNYYKSTDNQLTDCLELLAVLSRWSICLLEVIFLLLKKEATLVGCRWTNTLQKSYTAALCDKSIQKQPVDFALMASKLKGPVTKTYNSQPAVCSRAHTEA